MEGHKYSKMDHVLTKNKYWQLNSKCLVTIYLKFVDCINYDLHMYQLGVYYCCFT